MISALQSSTSTKHMSYLDLVLNPLKADSSTGHLVYSPSPSILTARNLLTDVFNIVHRSPTTSVIGTASADDLSSFSSRSRSTMHVATPDRHDTDAWTQERKVRDTELSAVAVSPSLGSDGTVPDDYFPVDVARSSFALMGLQTERPRTVEQFPTADGLREHTVVCPHDWPSLVAPSSGVSPANANIFPCSPEDLSEGRRRVGDILVRCGVIDVSGMSPIESTAVGCGYNTGARPIGTPVMPGSTAELLEENDELLVTALADWTSDWVHTLVIQPYLQGNFRFQHQGSPSTASTTVALRIRRVLSNVENPVQVAVHALWFIGTLTGNGAHNDAPFLSVSFFRYLHNNGTFFAEDFMFRTFVTCAMIGDKTVNDATLSTTAWNRLTRIPLVILNATEKYALSCLNWNVVMTRIQWQDTIIYLRSCIKMGSAFDPFAYDGTSPSGTMARCLDELISLSYADETYASQQGIPAVEILAPQPTRHFTRWEVFDAAEWCPEGDPVVNQKPRTTGIAPGADQNSSTLKVGTTAKDLLDSILGSSNAHLAQPAGTSSCGSFGVIGARLAHTIRIASGCQNAYWVPSHG